MAYRSDDILGYDPSSTSGGISSLQAPNF